jgi:signal transduction histidine kinase/integral membrane sensor domain MASE1
MGVRHACGLGEIMRASRLRRWIPWFSSLLAKPLPWPVGCAALFLAYLVLAEACYVFVFPPHPNAVFWLPSGLTLALFLRTTPARWPAWLLATLGAEALVVLQHGLPLPVALAWGVASVLLPLTGAWLLRGPAGHRFVFRRAEDVLRLALLGAGVGALPSALVATAASVAWLGEGAYWSTAFSWWSSDALGVLLLCPLFLAWTEREPARPRLGRTVEAVTLLLLLAGLGWWVFSSLRPRELDAALPFFLLPLTAWPALRFGARGATVATVLLDFMATWHTIHGRGPFAMLSQSVATRVLNLQSYIVFLNLFVLILAVVVVKEQQARAAAELAEQRSQFLAAASRAVSESLDYEESLVVLPRLCVQSLADWCVLDVVHGHGLLRLSGAHRDASKLGLIRELEQRYEPGERSPQPAARVLRTGEALLLSQLTGELLQAYSVDDENARLIHSLGTRTAMAVPLSVRGQTIGVLTLGSASPGRQYGPSDLELASELARRAAIALDNARLYRDAQETIRLRDEFLSIAAHELKTPVTSLQLTVQTLKRGAVAPSNTVPPSMARLEQQVKRLVRLISELLDVSRIVAGRMDVRLEEVELPALVRDVTERLADELSQAGCPLTLHVERPVVGRWDQLRLEQVVTNLLSNALKFGRGHPIEVSVSEADGTAKLVVRDHGIGIPSDRLPHIFGRFERAVSTRFYGGLGLGLYIAHSIVEALGGSIRAESTMGSGATFTVELPCAGPPPRALAPDTRD